MALETVVRAVSNTCRLFHFAYHFFKDKAEYGREFEALDFRRPEEDESEAPIYSTMKDLAVSIPAFLGNGYARLLGRTLTPDERKAQLIIGVLARVYDDLFDKEDVNPEHMKDALRDISSFPQTSRTREAFFDLYSELTKLVPESNKLFYDTFCNLNDAQKDSKKQREESTSLDEIARITERKGGYAALTFLTAINPNMSEKEREAFYKLGAWLQMVDDFTDIEKDRKERERTLATEHTFNHAYEILETYRREGFHAVKFLPYPENEKDWFLFNGFVGHIVVVSDLEAFNRYQSNPKCFSAKLARIKSALRIGLSYSYEHSDDYIPLVGKLPK